MISGLAEKQHSRSRSESMAKKQPAYQIPGKTLSLQMASRHQVEGKLEISLEWEAVCPSLAC